MTTQLPIEVSLNVLLLEGGFDGFVTQKRSKLCHVLYNRFTHSSLFPFFILAGAALGLGRMNVEIGENLDYTIGKEAHDAYHTALHNTSTIGNRSSSEQAHGVLVQPVYTTLSGSATTMADDASPNDQTRAGIAGYLLGLFGFDAFLVDILPNGIRGIRVVIKNDCGDVFTYELDGNQVGQKAHFRNQTIV